MIKKTTKVIYTTETFSWQSDFCDFRDNRPNSKFSDSVNISCS